MDRGQWETEMSSTCRSADILTSLKTVVPIPFTLSVLKNDQRKEFTPLMVCFSSGGFFSPCFHLQISRRFFPPNIQNCHATLLVSSVVWGKNELPLEPWIHPIPK